MGEQGIRKPDLSRLRVANRRMEEIGLGEIVPCIWVDNGGDAAIVVLPDGETLLCGSIELALRVAQLEWKDWERPSVLAADPSWPNLREPWQALVPKRQWLLRLCRWILPQGKR